MATFGYTSIGGDNDAQGGDVIRGSIFTLTEAGLATSITAALKRAANGDNNARCAIYRHSDLTLIAETEARLISLTTDAQWFTFNFPSPIVLDGSVEYLLVSRIDYTAENVSYSYTAGDADQGHAVTHNWGASGAFPDPLVMGSHVVRKYSIYCTYTTNLSLVSSAASEKITGTTITYSENRLVQTVTASLARVGSGSNNVKVAIYDHDSLALVTNGTATEQSCSLTTSFATFTFTFPQPPKLWHSRTYILAVWADYTAADIYLAYATGSTDQGHTETKAYGTFSDPLVPTHDNNNYTITCGSYIKLRGDFQKIIKAVEQSR